MTGLLALLTPEQKARALAYTGEDTMGRPKKFTETEAKDRRKTQTREAVRRTRKKKSEMKVISETGVQIVTEDFLSGEQTVEEWEKPAVADYVSERVFDGVKPIDDKKLEKLRKGSRKKKADCVEIVKADPRGTLKIDDSIVDCDHSVFVRANPDGSADCLDCGAHLPAKAAKEEWE